MRGLPSLILILIIGLMASCADGPVVSQPSAAPTGSPSPVPSTLPPQVLPLPGLAVDVERMPNVPLIELLSRSLEEDIAGWWRLDGRLANVGGAAARNVSVIVRFYDGTGVLLDTRRAVVAPQSLLAGNTGHYGLIWAPDPRIALVTVQPTWELLPANE